MSVGTLPLVVRGARAIWTASRTLTGTDLWCSGGQVVALVPAGGPPPPEAGTAVPRVIDAGGCVVVPGLVNAHHHLLQSAFRTLPGTRHVPMREWLAVMNGAYARVGVDGELTEAAARVGLSEALLCGVTTVADHHLTWPDAPISSDLDLVHGTASAARSLGARLVFVRGTAGDDAGRAAASVDALASEFGSRSADGRWELGVGPAGVHSDGADTFAALREVALTHRLVRRTQAGEQVDVEVAAARYGCRPLELLEQWGWLEPGVTVAHCCEIAGPEIEQLAASGVAVTHAPGCDLPMGWGLSPVGALLAAGVTVGLGTSGGGSNDGGHLLADARLAMQVAPLAGCAITAEQALTLATRGAAVGLGRDELGHLEPGAAADLAIYDLGGVADAGVHDPVGGLLWASPGRRPRDVVVGGQPVVAGGALVGAQDEQMIAAELAALLTRRGAA
ncbi:MAG: amidohydrolase family protein [Patulibacter sp.]